MCQSAPGTVVALDADGSAVVRERGKDRRALVLSAGEPVAVGDRVLVHAGLVVRRLSEQDAAAADAVWEELEVGG
jgi:hydrogenase maturation factor